MPLVPLTLYKLKQNKELTLISKVYDSFGLKGIKEVGY